MVKIEAIAKAAGVSVATVSRVLNGSERVAPATREAVLKAARQLGRAVDGEFARRRVLVAYVPSGQKMIEHFMASAEAYNLSPLYKMVPSSSLRAEDVAFDGDFDGVILIDGVISRAELEKLRAKTPVVECRNYNDVDREVSVMVDDVAMGHRLTKHIIESGRTRIATVRLDEIISSRPHAVERMRGYYAALAEAGLSPAKSYTRLIEDSPETLLTELLRDAGEEWDAIIFPEPLDELLDLQQLLREEGRDVALASFGDSAALERAGITATDQPRDAIAQASLFMLTSLMDGRLTPAASMQLRIEPTLAVRRSTK